MFVAIVMTEDGQSLRHNGTLAAVVDYDKDRAVSKAQTLLEGFEAHNPESRLRGYYVAVGELTERSKPKATVELIPLVNPGLPESLT